MLFKIWLTISFLLISLLVSIRLFGEAEAHKHLVNTTKVIFPLLLAAEFVLTLVIIWQ